MKNIKPVKCPLCGASMTYALVGETHSWNCTECPALLLENYVTQNLLDLLPAKIGGKAMPFSELWESGVLPMPHYHMPVWDPELQTLKVFDVYFNATKARAYIKVNGQAIRVNWDYENSRYTLTTEVLDVSRKTLFNKGD
jgi:hypothetical protein